LRIGANLAFQAYGWGSWIAGNYGQHGGGAFANYTGAGVLTSIAIHDGILHLWCSFRA
jgi:hypothetical protein